MSYPSINEEADSAATGGFSFGGKTEKSSDMINDSAVQASFEAELSNESVQTRRSSVADRLNFSRMAGTPGGGDRLPAGPPSSPNPEFREQRVAPDSASGQSKKVQFAAGMGCFLAVVARLCRLQLDVLDFAVHQLRFSSYWSQTLLQFTISHRFLNNIHSTCSSFDALFSILNLRPN